VLTWNVVDVVTRRSQQQVTCTGDRGAPISATDVRCASENPESLGHLVEKESLGHLVEKEVGRRAAIIAPPDIDCGDFDFQLRVLW
jgi:hypothetical protein